MLLGCGWSLSGTGTGMRHAELLRCTLTMLLVPTRCEMPAALLLSSRAFHPTLAAQLGLTFSAEEGEAASPGDP